MWRLRRELKRSFTLQWHITSRCDHRCLHCYESDRNTEMRMPEIREALRQFRCFTEGMGCSGHINIAGGEPLLHPGFFDLLAAIEANGFSFAVLSNGSLIDRAAARRLRGHRPKFVQISIEGAEATHDALRGRGDFESCLAAIRDLKAERIRTIVSFTAHRGNFREFPDAAQAAWRAGAATIWADRLIPIGSGADLSDPVLSPEETREFFRIMLRTREHGHVTMHRALQFLVCSSRPYRCAAGRNLLALMPDGTLLPCRRLPIPAGNVFETPLGQLYQEDATLRALRRDCVPEGCEGCGHSETCNGGLRCLAFAMQGRLFAADPGCWRSSREAGADAG